MWARMLGATCLGWIALSGLIYSTGAAIGGAITAAVPLRLRRHAATATDSAPVMTGAR